MHVIQGQIVMCACSNATRFSLSCVIYIGGFITHLANRSDQQCKYIEHAMHVHLLVRPTEREEERKKVDR